MSSAIWALGRGCVKQWDIVECTPLSVSSLWRLRFGRKESQPVLFDIGHPKYQVYRRSSWIWLYEIPTNAMNYILLLPLYLHLRQLSLWERRENICLQPHTQSVEEPECESSLFITLALWSSSLKIWRRVQWADSMSPAGAFLLEVYFLSMTWLPRCIARHWPVTFKMLSITYIQACTSVHRHSSIRFYQKSTRWP